MNRYIHRQEIIELLRDLVRSPSVNPPGDTSDCAKVILNKFTKENIDTQIIEEKKGACNVVARLPGEGSGRILLLNGHMDVVPPGEGWTVDPFGGEIRGDKIYGRGTCDMKSGLASMMAAIIGLKRSRVPFRGEIIFMAVADEETGSEFGTVSLLKMGIGKHAHFAIVSEPTSLRVELGNRGLRWIDLLVKGKACHAGRPHLGVNAIYYAAKLAQAIESMIFDKRNNAFEIPYPSISVTMINGGTKVNIIPNRCELTVDRRMIPGETGETVLGELKGVIDPILAREKELQIEVNMRPVQWDPYLLSENEPIVQATLQSVKEVTGKKPEVRGKSACTDGSYLFHTGGVPTVLFGPGNEMLSHQADECTSTEDLVLSVEILNLIFGKLLSKTN